MGGIRIPIRSLIALLMFGGTMINYVLRVNLNIAIVSMTQDSDKLCINKTNDESTVDEKGNVIFCWNEGQKGWILAGYFYGYIVLQVIGGSMSEKYGTKIVLGVTTLFSAVLALLIPAGSKENLWIVFTIRVLQGLAAGVTYPSLPPMITRWAPAEEQSKFVTFTYIGNTFGTMITYPISGVILNSIGWEALFYISGGIALLWFSMWTFFVSDDPENHRYLPLEEKEYILAHRKLPVSGIGNKKPPYLQILLCPTLWVLAFCDFASTFGLYMVIIEGPSFINNVLHKNILENGLLNALPQLAIFLYGLVFSSLADYILSKDWITKSTLRRLMAVISFGIPGITVAVLGYTTSSWILCIAVLSIGIGFRSAIYMGHIGSVYDVAPTYSGTAYGFVSTMGNISGFITPLVAAALTKEDPHDITGWRNLFWLSASFYFVAALAFPLLVKLSPAKFEQNNDGPEYQTISNLVLEPVVSNYGSTEDLL